MDTTAPTGTPLMLTEKQLLKAPKKNYMNAEQLAFFRDRLLHLREDLMERLDQARAELSEEHREGDDLDRAAVEETINLKVRALNRDSKLLPKIEEALRRIEDGSYGYCEATGQKIGLERLLLRPTATYSAEEKNRQEEIEQAYRQ